MNRRLWADDGDDLARWFVREYLKRAAPLIAERLARSAAGDAAAWRDWEEAIDAFEAGLFAEYDARAAGLSFDGRGH